MTLFSIAFSRWWSNPKTLDPNTAWANIGVGIACAVCAVFDLDLGLGSYARPFFAYFAVLSTTWGVLALRLGPDPTTARPLRLAGDIAAWLALIGFSVLGMFAADDVESGPLLTLGVFVVVTAGVAAPGMLRDYRQRLGATN